MWQENRRVLLDAHRGNSRYFPENTMPAFQSALTLKIDMMETDVHMTKDGEIIVMHDENVDRTTNGTGKVGEFTLAQIKDLDAGSWKDEKFSGLRVPAFVEFLELAQTRKDLDYIIEFKDYPQTQGERAYLSCDRTIALIEEYHMSDHVILNSFSGAILEYIDEKYQHKYRIEGFFPLSRMGEGLTRDPYEYLYSICLFDREKVVADREHFEYVISRGVKTWVYYPDENPEIYKLAVERGAVGLTANDPGKAHEILKKLGVR